MRKVKGLLGVIAGLVLLFQAGSTVAWADDGKRCKEHDRSCAQVSNNTNATNASNNRSTNSQERQPAAPTSSRSKASGTKSGTGSKSKGKGSASGTKSQSKMSAAASASNTASQSEHAAAEANANAASVTGTRSQSKGPENNAAENNAAAQNAVAGVITPPMNAENAAQANNNEVMGQQAQPGAAVAGVQELPSTATEAAPAAVLGLLLVGTGTYVLRRPRRRMN